MPYQNKNPDPSNIEKYSELIKEIKNFIKAKKEKSPTIGGFIENLDLNGKILNIKLQSTNNNDLSKGSSILVKDFSDKRKGFEGVILNVYNSTIKIETNINAVSFENKKITIDSNVLNVSLNRLEKLIENIEKGKINGNYTRILDLFIDKRNKPKYSDKNTSFYSKKLNKEQKTSVKKSLEADDFHLIIGPPGTGKTFVIEELIKQLSKRKQKILITAWANLAVDNIINRLDKNKKQRIVRIGPFKKVDKNVREYHIDELMQKHEGWKEVEDLQIKIENLRDSIPKIKDALINTSNKINQLNKERNIFHKEKAIYEKEKIKYEELNSKINNKEELIDLSSIINDITILHKSSDNYLSLSNKILELNKLKSIIPSNNKIEQLKEKTRKMKYSILMMEISSFFSNNKKKELIKIKQAHEKVKNKLNNIKNLRLSYQELYSSCIKKFKILYNKEKGHPDQDALKTEIQFHKLTINEYLPQFKDQEEIKSKRMISELNQEVYNLYLESLNRNIDFMKSNILNKTDAYNYETNQETHLQSKIQNTYSLIDYSKNQIEIIKKKIAFEIINSADLIAATAISTGHYHLNNIEFDTLIMDEASQVSSFISLIPLSKCKKFILVGDNKQIQPIEERHISKELNLSIFNRLFEMYRNSSTLLTTQYRMNKEIADIVSSIFYNNNLITPPRIAKEILSILEDKSPILNPTNPSLFIDTSKAEYYEEEIGSSCSNSKEAKYISNIISLLIKKGINPKDIGIITPYNKQKDLITKYLNNLKLTNVEVNTVHKFQGREKDIIIMSFAKSKKYAFPQYKLRFLENETLINVALSRAKKKLILIGNAKTLCQSPLLHKVINAIGKDNIVVL